MENDKSRFNVEQKLEIKDRYVLYVKDLFVSFKEEKELKKEKNKLKNLKSQIKALDKEIYKEKIFDLKTQYELIKSNYKKIKKNKKLFSFEINKSRKKVLKGVTFGLREGETLALVGANGAGKTVLMETILGFINSEKGEIFLNLGEKTYSKNIKRVGIQFQQSNFLKGIKVMGLIKLYVNLYGEFVDRIELLKMIENFGIEDYIDSKVDRLSGGQKQRLNLLLAIMHQPKLMILDEFITGLDVKSVRKIIQYINYLKIKNNASMIIISHQPEEIEELSDRILVLNDGKIKIETNVEEIKNKNKSIALFVEENI